jgi:hypothetical protein
VAAATTAGTIGLSGIVASDTDASVKLYSDSGFSTEVTGESTITLILGGTKIVYILVTAEDDTTKTYYAVSIEKPQDVLTAYSLKASEAAEASAAASGITLDSAEKLNEVVTLKLGGTVGAAYRATATSSTSPYTVGANFEPSAGFWGDSHEESQDNRLIRPALGVYTPVYIHGIFTTGTSSTRILAIKQTNQALRFYQQGIGLLAGNPTSPVAADQGNLQTIFIPSNTASPVRWRLYGENVAQGQIADGGTFGILIWNGGTGTTYSPKTATIDIAQYQSYVTNATLTAGGYQAKIIIDYSDVTW